MRKLATAAAVSLALSSGGAFGLGLGDIEMQSALNQPMDAEIPLTSVRPGELDGMIVQLASAEAFARAGIDRSQALTDLRFSVDQSSGIPVIKIESARPVVEPFLNFLLEVDWPQGRMVREYTVLLDPPVFMTPSASERNTAADQPALLQGGEAALVVPTPIERNPSPADEGFEVDLGQLENAPTEEILSLDEATSGSISVDDGELVSLEELSDESLLSIGPGVVDGAGSSVSLSDLGAPNIEANAQREANALEAFDVGDIQVETAGSTDEVTDNVVVGEDGQLIGGDLGDDGSTIVSLEGIEEEIAQPAVVQAASEVTVNRGDTLFEIARDNTPSGASVQQMMMAMLAANESAFINNNINLIRAGAILRIPDQDEATNLTQAQALAAIGDQNQLWQDYRDSLRATAGTQVAQNIAPESPAEQSETAATAPAATGDTSGQSIESASLESDASIDGLSAEARAILDNARNEILNGEELKIVADNSPSSTAASATADETSDTDATRIGEVNLQLQLAREELSATRMRTTDLSDQASELENTTDSLDAMVSLRQNEVARLEAQLSEARKAAEEKAQLEADNAAQEVIDAANAAEKEATDTVGEIVDQTESAVAEPVSGLADNVVAEAEVIEDSGINALTEAGETLGQVELLPSDNDVNSQTAAETAVIDTAADTKSWYQEFLEDPKRMAIAGVGALGLLGVLGTLLFRRKRRAPEESMLDSIDAAEFNMDDAPAAPDTKAVDTGSRLDDTAAFAAAGAATVGAGVIALGDKSDDSVEKMDETLANGMDDANDSTLAFGALDDGGSLPSSQHDDAEETLDKDDTISEVDVYLAYGLHGQAEELLTKAIERKPDNAEYASKLLQTFHAQGNSDAFHASAADFHQRFGGSDNPEWQAIAVMGTELNPGNPLYAAGSNVVSPVGDGDFGGSAMDDDDFASFNTAKESSSISRDFSSAAPAVDLIDDETDLMDQSLDPAFAFDEGDLEATGDFTAISEELASENDNSSIDFPGFDDAGTAANEALKEDQIGADVAALDDALSMDELDGLTDSVDDLTLDLDQLSGDLELDSAELLSSDLSDLDIPDLSADNDLLLDSSGAMGNDDDGNEMDTMMDLAKAYIDMGDKDSASSALGEIVKSGSPEQVTEAETLLRKMS